MLLLLRRAVLFLVLAVPFIWALTASADYPADVVVGRTRAHPRAVDGLMVSARSTPRRRSSMARMQYLRPRRNKARALVRAAEEAVNFALRKGNQ